MAKSSIQEIREALEQIHLPDSKKVLSLQALEFWFRNQDRTSRKQPSIKEIREAIKQSLPAGSKIPSSRELEVWFRSQRGKKEKLPSARGVENFFGFDPGTFDHIPHYARDEALYALRSVRDMEARRVFRPGLYYVVLSDLCRATEASQVLGNELSKRRIETFILTCIEALGRIETTNYHLFLREIGDAVLLLFSSFYDVYLWWVTMNSWLKGRNNMWASKVDLSHLEFIQFSLEAKTVVHVGEVDYSAKNIPLSLAINQVFKIEKKFKADELGITEMALLCARPIFRSLGFSRGIKLRPKQRGQIVLPGATTPLLLYLVDTYGKPFARQKQKSSRTVKKIT